MGKILLPLSGWKDDANAANAAFTLGKAFRHLVHGVHIRQSMLNVFPVFGEGVAIAGVKEVMGAVEESAKALSASAYSLFEKTAAAAPAQILDTFCSAPGFAARYEEAEGFPSEEIAKRARLCDFTVFALDAVQRAKAFDETLNQVILGARRPAYLACRRVETEKPVVLAWDGSTEAAAALFAARPFFDKTSCVYVAQIKGDIDGPDRGVSDCAWAMEYLRTEGRPAEAAPLTKDQTGRTADQLIEFAQRIDAGLIVMGAFGHSRLREAILGGVTLRMIQHAQTPLLLAH